MSSQFKLSIKSDSPQTTVAIGAEIASKCRGSEVFWLRGDLGSGKTQFTRGLAAVLAPVSEVTSPSFTIQNSYSGDVLSVEHFDFYRLSDPGIMSQELAEIIGDDTKVVVIEWGDVVSGLLGSDAVVIEFSSLSESKRQLDVSAPAGKDYLFKGLQK